MFINNIAHIERKVPKIIKLRNELYASILEKDLSKCSFQKHLSVLFNKRVLLIFIFLVRYDSFELNKTKVLLNCFLKLL